MVIRSVRQADRESWKIMRQALWPAPPGEHAGTIERFFGGKLREPIEVLIALDNQGDALGFIELSIRAYGEGCGTDHVAFVEGWYVEPRARRKRVGAALMNAAETWARSRGCSELASDTEAENASSAAAHRAVGFTETAVIRCFKKSV
jgi:aminoglycoside 6'-N-acetyltransferase I